MEGLINELDNILSEAVVKCPILDCNDPELATKLSLQLEEFSCSHVKIDDNNDSIATTHFLLNDTFPSFQGKPYKEALEYWRKNSFSSHKIWGKSIKMPYPPILETTERIHFKHPITKTIHVYNPLVAKNSICIWESLIQRYPQINPNEWMKFNENYRFNISEDGVKITYNDTYKQTPLHFDGHCPFERVQIIHSRDQGPMRLFVIPKSNHPRVQELIKKITGQSVTDGFVRFKQGYPELYKVLLKNAICCESPHLQFFKAGIWHFEGNKDHKLDVLKDETKKSIISRSYVGVIAIKASSERITDMITLAYLREHGWSMDSFAKENKNNRREGLFVNDKTNQAGNVFNDYEDNREEFDRLRKTSLEAMKQYLKERCSPLRLELYGIKKTDL